MLTVQVIPDRFAQGAQNLSSSLSKSAGAQPHVRRMTRGVVLKEETFATLRVQAGDGSNLLLVDAGSRAKYAASTSDGHQAGEVMEINGKRATDVYSNFLLQQVVEDRVEKSQILETFGEAFIFLFGERARVITFQGVLANTFDFNWEAEWWFNYENYLRGTRCIENDARVFISFDETLVGGYILGCNAQKSTENPRHVIFQFQLFITNYSNFSAIGDPSAYPVANPAVNLNNHTITESMASTFRPIILPEIGAAIRAYPADGTQPSLAEGILQNAIGPFVDAFNSASKFANQSLKYLSNLVSGDVVRVPVGFAGSLVYDEGVGGLDGEKLDELMQSVNYGGVITYTTFDQNNDEYVGAGDHYGSSVTDNGAVQYDFGAQTLDDVLNQGAALFDKAKQQWEAAGLSVPDSSLGPISSLLVSRALGLAAVGATTAWRTQAPPSLGFSSKFLAGGLAHSIVAPGE